MSCFYEVNYFHSNAESSAEMRLSPLLFSTCALPYHAYAIENHLGVCMCAGVAGDEILVE